RRHQKVIEEAPAPGMDDATRTTLCAAAVKAARAVDYVGAGTIEFIADASDGLRADRIWFMEMNTRLQVEHPVTEAITGVDLVEWQLRVAAGQPLPMAQADLAINGWAMEARLYAEDPRTGFLPSVGVLDQLYPLVPWAGGPAPRYDMGFASGDSISPYYDPMLGKIICHGVDRAAAAADLAYTCAATTVWPVKTNLGFVARCLAHPAFVRGDVDTGFIDRHAAELATPALPMAQMAAHAAAELMWNADAGTSPWAGLPGLRINAPNHAIARVIDSDGAVHEVDLCTPAPAFPGTSGGDEILISINGEQIGFRLYVPRGGAAGVVGDGTICSPMPGRIIAVDVAPGQAVAQGQRLVTLEAMKMEHSLTAPFDGVVAELHVAAGAQVPVAAVLVRIDPTTTP
ncbi:MAG: biotin/lipoyl-containing protein, partial [Sphingopyxis sp.]